MQKNYIALPSVSAPLDLYREAIYALERKITLLEDKVSELELLIEELPECICPPAEGVVEGEGGEVNGI